MKPLILIVEDEPGIADTLQYALRTEGFEPRWCNTGEAADPQPMRVFTAGIGVDQTGLPAMSNANSPMLPEYT